MLLVPLQARAWFGDEYDLTFKTTFNLYCEVTRDEQIFLDATVVANLERPYASLAYFQLYDNGLCKTILNSLFYLFGRHLSGMLV